jgi:O-antigen/teichoic acid export membrane protein
VISTAKNTLYLLIAYIYQKLISLFYFIILARYLGADDFGKYTFALSFTALISVLIDFGLFPVLTREVARDKNKTKDYFSNILGFCLLSGGITLILDFILINVLKYPIEIKMLVYLAGLVVLLDTLALSVYQLFRGYLNLKFESLGIIAHKTVMLIAGLILVYLVKANLFLMMLPLLFGSIFYFLNAIFFLKRKLGLWPRPTFKKEILKSLLILSWPFFLAGIFSKFYATIDTILLSYLDGNQSVGWYSAAQKLTNAFLLLIAGSLSSALYPALSYYFVRSKENLNKLFNQAVFYLMLITIPLVCGLIVLARQIILLIYGGGYLPAISILIILSLSIPFVFFDYIVSGLLNACERQKINTKIHGFGVLLFIVFNLISIPFWGYLGAGLSVLVSFFILFILEIYWAKKIVKMELKYLINKIGLITLSSFIMSGLLLLIGNNIHIFWLVLVGMASYFTCAWLFKLISKNDLKLLKQMGGFKKDFLSDGNLDQNN